MTDKDQYKIRKEPFYQAQDKEVALYEAAYIARLPVMIKGPTGCGKSRFVEYMAWKLNKPEVRKNRSLSCVYSTVSFPNFPTLSWISPLKLVT